jgi:hypothetical protein
MLLHDMGTDNQNDNLLSSWKEIAKYLKAGVRSCIRWKKEAGLPVCRAGEGKNSRVYAYKNELDGWLQQRGRVQNIRPVGKRRLRIRKIILVALVLVVLLSLISVFFLKISAPRDAFRLADFSIITVEPDGIGRLRVWGFRRPDDFQNIWSVATSKTNTVKHSSVAMGDIDGDKLAEVVVPTYAKAKFVQGEKESVFYKIFLNIYKQGKKGIWKSTFYSDGDCLWEDRQFSMNEVALANLDHDPANEIILKSATGLAVYKYLPGRDELRMTAIIPSFEAKQGIFLNSIAVGDLDGMPPSEIVVSANLFVPGKPVSSAMIFVVRVQSKALEIVKSIPVDAILTRNSLRMGNVLPGNNMAFFTTGYRRKSGEFEGFLLGWDSAGERIVDLPIPESRSDKIPSAKLAIGDLTFEAGEDIIIIQNRPITLLLYSWAGEKLELIKKAPLVDDPTVVLNDVRIADTDRDGRSEIIVGGAARVASDPSIPHFFLGVFGYSQTNNGIKPRWMYAGGKREDREVWSIALGKRKS